MVQNSHSRLEMAQIFSEHECLFFFDVHVSVDLYAVGHITACVGSTGSD